MFRQVEDFLEANKTNAKATVQILGALTDENLRQSIAEGHRTLGQIAWHIVTSIPEMMNRTGLDLKSVHHETPPPARAAEILNAYRKVNDEMADAVLRNWDDQTLLETDDMYGETWRRGTTLSILIHHEIHHRGQMAALLRQAGAKVPGIYGPSKEEWSQYGMEAPPY